MVGIDDCFHDSPCHPLALYFIATRRSPVFNDIPIHAKSRIAHLFPFEYFQKIGFVQELCKVVSIHISNNVPLRREIVLFRLLGHAGFEGAFNGVASKVVRSGKLAVPQKDFRLF